MTGKLLVFTDGRCPLCRGMRSSIEPLDRHGCLIFLDCTDPENQGRIAVPPETLLEEMHVQAPDGRISRGFHAWLCVLRVLPMPWRIVGFGLAVPPLSWLGPPVYRWIARYRYKLWAAKESCADVCKTHWRT